ncbi:MAG: GntR family transcriptional regulator [Candidatus Dormibacteria bacterium]
MNPLNPQSGQPLHLQLANELRGQIRRGEFKPGDRLPPERALIELYGTSRTTVSAALAVLKAEGLLTSGPGRGTFVRTPPPIRLAFSRFSRRKREPGLGPWQSATRRAGVEGETRMLSVEQQIAGPDLAYRLGVAESAAVVLRSRLMLANGHPVQVQNAWYPFDLIEGTDLARGERILDGIFAALERLGRPPVSSTEEVVARAPTPEEAALLRLGPGIPVLVITRTTLGGEGRVLEVLEVIASGEATILVYEDLPLS